MRSTFSGTSRGERYTSKRVSRFGLVHRCVLAAICFSLFTRRVRRKEMIQKSTRGIPQCWGGRRGNLPTRSTHPSCSTRKRVRACGKEAVGKITWLSRGNKRGKNARHSFQLLLSHFLFTFCFPLSNPGSGEVVRLGRITYSFLVYYILNSFSL